MPSAHIWVNSCLRPSELSPFPPLQDISISGHTWCLRFRPWKPFPSPAIRDTSAPAIRDISVSGHSRLISGWDLDMNHPVEVHQQQLQLPSETPRCSGWLWRLWRNLVPSDGESKGTRHPSDGSCCIPPLRRLLYHASYSCDASHCILLSLLWRQASFTLHPECGDTYAPSERHVCYTLRRGCS